MIGAEDAQAVGEIPLVQGDGLVEPAHLPVGFCKVIARDEGAGVVGAEDPFMVRQVLLE